MQPSVQYVRSADGTNIAHWAIGEGSPLVYLPATPFTHVQREWDMPDSRAWYERLARNHRLVRYDARGFGLSDRGVDDLSLDANVADLHAVIERLGLDSTALMALGDSGMVAIAYAARYPERVSQLILWCTYARRADVSMTPQTRSLQALHDQDWFTYTETAARVILGWGADDAARRFAEFYRECASPESVKAIVPHVYSWDVTEMLRQVNCPALVLHRRHLPNVPEKVARDLATGLPNARLLLMEGSTPIPWLGDTESVIVAIAEFMGEEAPPDAVRPGGRAAPVTILFTDLTGSTSTTQRLGDEQAQDLLVRRHNRIVRDALVRHGGREVKHTGDGIMASFPSAVGAIEGAIEIQRRAQEHTEMSPDVPILVKIGVNSGEPIAEERDLYGSAVQIAARLCEMAEPGQILTANVVRELTTGKGFLYNDLGQTVLRGFEDPVRVYQVHWGETG